MGQNYTLSTISTSHFTTALVTDAVETETFPGLRGDGKGKIKAIILRAVMNLDYRIEMYDKDGNIIAFKDFLANTATKPTGATEFVYTTENEENFKWSIPLTIPNVTVTIGLRNMSATTKEAGTDGAITVSFIICKG